MLAIAARSGATAYDLDPRTEGVVRAGLNFTLITSLGDLDLLGDITGGGTYEQLLPTTVEGDLFGFRCRCITLEKLIHVKRSAGRIKDLEVIGEGRPAVAFASTRDRECGAPYDCGHR